MSNDLEALSVRLGQLATRLPGPVVKEMGETIGDGAVKDATEAVRGDGIGDLTMSGWGVPITADYRFTKGSVIVTPSKMSGGPFRVMETGRHFGETGQVQGPGAVRKGRNAGATLRNKNGALRKVRAFTAKRWNGHTRPKRTWSDALELMQKKTPERAMQVLGEEARKHITGG